MKRIIFGIGRALGTAGRATIALIGICTVGIAFANYTMTQGSGTTFGSIVVSTVHYAQMLICDPTTPTQCGSVGSNGAISVQGVSGGTPQPVSVASGAIVDGADVAQGHVADTACPSSGTATVVGCVRAAVVALGSPGAISQTTDGTTNGVRQTSQYPSGATAVQGSTTGTTAATATTLAATASVTNYVCQISIRANATAAATGNATLSDGTKTYNFTQWTAPAASGLGIVEEIFNPCYPASAVNTAWTLTSAAPGTGGVVSVAISGYQK